MTTMTKTCACGCGTPVKNTYAQGHNRRGTGWMPEPGSRFGDWTVLGEGERGHSRTVRAQCACGYTTNHQIVNLLRSDGCAECMGKRMFKDRTGDTYGQLKVLAFAHRKHGATYWHCECSCGETRIVRATELDRVVTACKSCTAARSAERRITHGYGMDDRTYRTWAAMKSRCTNPNDDGYKWYGAIGVTYHPDWKFFENFLRDMGDRPAGRSLSRFLDMGNYEPGNCAWHTDQEQADEQRKKRALLKDQGEV